MTAKHLVALVLLAGSAFGVAIGPALAVDNSPAQTAPAKKSSAKKVTGEADSTRGVDLMQRKSGQPTVNMPTGEAVKRGGSLQR